MTRTTIRLTAGSLVALASVACGGTTSTLTPDSRGTAVPDLAGQWRSACVDPGTGQALRLSFDLTPASWALEYETFSDPACAAPALVVHIEGAYAVSRPSPGVPDAYEARFGFTRKLVTPRTDAAAGMLVQACGGGSFAVGVATDISAGCPGLGAYPIASCPADFDLVSRTGNQLRFGARPADNNLCTEARRPTELSPLRLDKI